MATFVGNNRQMLNDIRDSLHHIRKAQLEAADCFHSPTPSPNQLHRSLDIVDKSTSSISATTTVINATLPVSSSSVTLHGTKKGLENHHKTLEEIRKTLQPYQTNQCRNHIKLPTNEHMSRLNVQQIMAIVGVDEVRFMSVMILDYCTSLPMWQCGNF